MVMDKGKLGNFLGVSSIFPVLLSMIIFFVLRGPNADIYFNVTIYTVLSIIGLILAIVSAIIAKKRSIGVIGIITNIGVLICAFLLLLAMGISEP